MKATSVQKLFPALGTVNSVTAYGKDASEAVERVKEKVLELHGLWSVFDQESRISEINRLAGESPVRVDHDTFEILDLAKEYAAETEGAFDITYGPLSSLWCKAIRSHTPPDRHEISELRKSCGIDGLVLDETERTAYLKHRGMSVDLGGIAKGWAADEAGRILREYDIEHAQINFGGTVVSIGMRSNVGIQDPFQQTGVSFGHLPLTDMAAVTSGSNERYFVYGGKRYHHIIDPRTGWPSCSGLASVTLIGSNAASLDAMATGVFILGAEKSLPLLKRHKIEAVFVTDDGEVQVTPGLTGQFSMDTHEAYTGRAGS